MRLAVPLLLDQIEAAKSLHRRLEQWVASDRALYLLSHRIPGFAIDSTLLKVAAINQLYFTNVYAVPGMARHITEVMAGEVSELKLRRCEMLETPVRTPLVVVYSLSTTSWRKSSVAGRRER